MASSERWLLQVSIVEAGPPSLQKMLKHVLRSCEYALETDTMYAQGYDGQRFTYTIRRRHLLNLKSEAGNTLIMHEEVDDRHSVVHPHNIGFSLGPIIRAKLRQDDRTTGARDPTTDRVTLLPKIMQYFSESHCSD